MKPIRRHQTRRAAELLQILRALSSVVLLASALFARPSLAGDPPACVGDCDGDGVVAVSELTTGVRIVLGMTGVEACTALDDDSSETAEIDELMHAIRNALDQCNADEEAVFLIRACASVENPQGEMFRVLIRDPVVIATAESLIGPGPQQILTGSLAAGDGGFNTSWSWHLDPKTVGFTDFAIELCDSCPSFVEEDLDYWLCTVGQYCPWSTEVLLRER